MLFNVMDIQIIVNMHMNHLDTQHISKIQTQQATYHIKDEGS